MTFYVWIFAYWFCSRRFVITSYSIHYTKLYEDWKPSVQLEDGTWVSVITWFTDAKMVEIISGLEKGYKIVY